MIALLAGAVLAGTALAAPLPPPDDVGAPSTDYRRILGLGAVVSGGVDFAGVPFGTTGAELWLGETLAVGFGARAGERDLPGGAAFGVVPALSWGARVLSVRRTVALDVAGRHVFGARHGGGIGGAVEVRVAGPHLARATVLAGFDGVPSVELAYTLRWER